MRAYMDIDGWPDRWPFDFSAMFDHCSAAQEGTCSPWASTTSGHSASSAGRALPPAHFDRFRIQCSCRALLWSSPLLFRFPPFPAASETRARERAHASLRVRACAPALAGTRVLHARARVRAFTHVRGQMSARAHVLAHIGTVRASANSHACT